MVKKVSQELGKNFSSRALSFLLVFTLILPMGCGTGDRLRLKDSRDAYLRDDFVKSESSLFTPEVFKESENRLLHFYFLSSIAMSEGQFEKAVYFLNKARDYAKSVRSDSGSFEWFSHDYKSNPIEYSYLHSMLVMAYTMLAAQGSTPAWVTPEIKDNSGNVLVTAQSFPARSYSAKEVADFRLKARSELLAWDSFLETLKNTYGADPYYKEDLWARALASYIHGATGDRTDQRSAELLTDQMKKIFTVEFSRYPSASTNAAKIEPLISKLREQAKNANRNAKRSSFFVCEAGVMSRYKIQRFHLGLSTLFSQIQDPGLRSMMEQIGMQVILNEAPEFGLVLFSGAIAGAISGATPDDDENEFDGPPRFFTDAVDRSFGFEIQFPTLRFPASDTEVSLQLLKPGEESKLFHLPILSPLQEILATELKERENKEMFKKAIKIGAQYLAILIPAIKAYQAADREGNGFKKLAILAGFYIAKKAIDRANTPDLRSWSYLPKLIAADLIPVPEGTYQTKILIDNHFGHFEKDLGPLPFGDPKNPLVHQRVGEIPILNRSDRPSAAFAH